MVWLSSRTQEVEQTIGEAMAEMRAEEKAWRERVQKRDALKGKYVGDEPFHVEPHPKLYCGRCGGTADKPFERLRPFHEVKNGVITAGWRCG